MFEGDKAVLRVAPMRSGESLLWRVVGIDPRLFAESTRVAIYLILVGGIAAWVAGRFLTAPIVLALLVVAALTLAFILGRREASQDGQPRGPLHVAVTQQRVLVVGHRVLRRDQKLLLEVPVLSIEAATVEEVKILGIVGAWTLRLAFADRSPVEVTTRLFGSAEGFIEAARSGGAPL